MQVDAKELACGHWADILAAAGLDKAYLVHGKGGPCPVCNDGVDRYMWSKKFGGVYVCRNCTQGKYTSPINLLMSHMGYSYREASDHIRSYFGINGSPSDLAVVQRLAQAPKTYLQPDPEKAIARMNRHWNGARQVREGDPVFQYLVNRIPQLTKVPDDIRYHPELEYWTIDDNQKLVLLGLFPGMVVRGFDPLGRLVQLHKTYLTPDGHKADVPNVKKTDMGVGSNSYALRMGVPTDVLGVCEGIETGLASTLMKGMPVWPCHSADIMANFEIPSVYHGVVRKLVIFADSDHEKKGVRKGEMCAKKLADRCRQQGIRTLIMRPAKVGADFADLAT